MAEPTPTPELKTPEQDPQPKRQVSPLGEKQHSNIVEPLAQLALREGNFEKSNPLTRSSTAGTQELLPHQQKSLERFFDVKTRKVSQHGLDHHGDAHGHHDKPPSIVTAIISGIINWLLMFGLCCAYGMILFGDSWHLQHQSLGVKMNLFTACFVGLAVAAKSKIPVAIGGPDLNPVVFLGGIVGTIGESIADQLALEYPDTRRLGDWSRSLASSSDVEFCDGGHLQDHLDACDVYHDELRATAMFATAISSLFLGVIFFGLGRLKLTRFVAYVPTSVMEAFLACVGYKVFKYALKFSKFQERQFIPAAICGVTLYFVKALHLGNPAVMIPLFLFVPLSIFYVIIFAGGSDLDQARKDGYMFPELPDVDFWTVWTEGFGNPKKINFKAWSETLPDLVVMIVVCLLDCLLKLAGTENKLKIAVDKDYEIQLHGVSNLMTSLSFSSVGYMQLKFNVINFGILGNLRDRRGGFVYAILCGAGFFGTIQYFNYMPRFFLSLLLFFAGAGFVAENLWGSRQYLRGYEWLEIIVILLVFVFTEKLLYAVVVGGLLTCFSFIATAAEIPCVLGTHLKGGHFATIDRHEPVLQRNLEHITNSWLLVVRLKGYVFFGSAQSLVKLVREKIRDQEDKPDHTRLRYVIFDCKLLDGMDASAAKMMRMLNDDAKAAHIAFLWSSINEERAHQFRHRKLMQHDNEWFESLSEVLLFLEDQAVKYLKSIQENWLAVHPALALYHNIVHKQDEFDPFRNILTSDTMRHGCPWIYCSKVRLEQHKTLLWTPGKLGVDLFLLHSGAVGLYTSLPNERTPSPSKRKNRNGEVFASPVAIYRHGWFLNTEALTHLPTQYYAVALQDGEAISWSETQWFRMSHAKPAMATAIGMAVMKQVKHSHGLAQKQVEKVVEENATPTPTANMFRKAHSLDEDSVEWEKFEFLPAEVENVFSNLETAGILEGYGLFDSPTSGELDQGQDDKTILPDLPDRYLKDLEIAFDTYVDLAGSPYVNSAESRGDHESTVPGERGSNTNHGLALPAGDFTEALKYAGIPNTMVFLNGIQSLSYTEYLWLGRCALMARFNAKQIASLQAVFDRYDVDKSGQLELDELETVLRQTFHPFVSLEEVVSICAFWDEDRSGKIDIHEFRELVSRLMRQVEQEWSVLVGLRELFGDPKAKFTDLLTAEDLCKNSHVMLSEERAQEMLWAADWRTDRGKGKFLELRDVPAFLILHTEKKVGTLPPAPHAKHANKIVKPLKTLDLKTPRGNQSQEIPPKLANLVYDLREPKWRGRALEESASLDSSIVTYASTMFSLGVGLTEGDDEDLFTPTPRLPEKSFRKQVDDFLNNPASSMGAHIWSYVAGCTVLFSFFVLFAEHLINNLFEDDLWDGFEIYITAFFTVEYVTRLLVTDNHIEFVKNKRNVCDLVATLPYYAEVAFDMGSGKNAFGMLRIIRMTRAFRLIRIFRIPGMAKLSSSLGAIVMILAIVWGIYLKDSDEYASK